MTILHAVVGNAHRHLLPLPLRQHNGSALLAVDHKHHHDAVERGDQADGLRTVTDHAGPHIEMREIEAVTGHMQRATLPEGPVKLGSFLASIAREAGCGLTDEEHAVFEVTRIKSPARAASFE